MYRLFGVLFLIVTMTWTWKVVHSYSALDTEAHAAIQNQLLNYLQQKIIEKTPDAQDITFPKLWTETITEHKLLASFEIAYATKTDPSSINRVRGELTLYREPTTKRGEVEWRVLEPKITDQSMEFGDGIIITPNGIIEPNTPTTLTEPPPEGEESATEVTPEPAAQTEPPTAAPLAPASPAPPTSGETPPTGP